MCDTFFWKHYGETNSNTKFEHFEIISFNKPAILLFLPPVLAFFNHSRLNWFNAVNFKDILKFDIILEIIQLSFEEIKKLRIFVF